MPLNIQFSRFSVLAIAIVALLIPVAWIEYDVLQWTHGTLSYPLDDTFIHMAVARNLAFYKVWGITQYSFQSTSSSPLYTLLLAGLFLLMGSHVIIPLIINVIAGIGFLFTLQNWLARQGLSYLNQLGILLLVILLTPIPLLVVCGMEHMLQLLFCFLFIYIFSEAEGRLSWKIYLYGLLMVGIRYEGIFVVGLACLILLSKHKWWTAIGLGVISYMPALIFGLISISKGSYFMPNSVLLKSGAPPLNLNGLLDFFTGIFWNKLFFVSRDYNILSAQRLLIILPFTYLFFWGFLRQWVSYRNILIIMWGAALAHVSFVFPSPYPRYEAWLIGCSLPVILTIILKQNKEKVTQKLKGAEWMIYALLVVLLMPLLFRCKSTFENAERSCINIYEQQYQMAQFVHKYYDLDGIAFNDIGAVSYYSEGRKLDLFGIASLDVLKSKRMHYWSPAFADSLIHRERIKIAMLYDRWFSPTLLHKWNKVASWQVSDNYILGDDSVSFFAIDTANIASLRKNLEAYQPSLPPGIKVRYYK